MSIVEQRICAWSGVAFLLLFGVGWVLIARFLPPHSPGASAEAIAAIYQTNPVRIRLGLALALFGGGFMVPFLALISEQMRRMGSGSALLPNIQLVCGAVAILMVFTVPMMAWETIAFRPDRPVQITLAISDFAWLMFAMTLSPFFIQFLAIALAVFLDRGHNAIFPRWAAYFNAWMAVLILPAGIIAMFHSGPFAWNGLLAFWLPVGVFVIWIACMFFLLLGTINRQAQAA